MTAVDFQKGQTVTFASAVTGHSASGGYGRHYSHEFARNATAEVTTVRRLTLTVRIREERYGVKGWYSYNVPRENLKAPNGEAWIEPPAKPKPRKLGEMPTEGDHIAMDDPRIAWIWDDVAKHATNRGYCSTYDEISDALGIPGREREIRVDTTMNGVRLTAYVKARNARDAENVLKAKLTGATA